MPVFYVSFRRDEEFRLKPSSVVLAGPETGRSPKWAVKAFYRHGDEKVIVVQAENPCDAIERANDGIDMRKYVELIKNGRLELTWSLI